MNDYTMTVQLPSAKAKGIYPDRPEYSGDIVLRMMEIADEKKVFGSYNENTVNELLKSCITSPEINPEELIPNDRHFLLVKLRELSYGDTYHSPGEVECEECGSREEYKFSISDVPVHELSEEFEEPVVVTLPLSKKEVGLHILRQRELDNIRSKAKKLSKTSGTSVREIEFLEKLAAKIKTINGAEASRAEAVALVKELKAMDRAFIDYQFEKVQLGYDTTVTCKCPKCQADVEVPFVMTGEFFRPRFD